jgi:hypothetical protein
VVLYQDALLSAAGDDELIGTEGKNSGNTLASTGEYAVDPQRAKLTRRVNVEPLDGLGLAGPARPPHHRRGGGAGVASSERTRGFLLERGYRLHGLTRQGRLCPPGSPEVFVSRAGIALPQ